MGRLSNKDRRRLVKLLKKARKVKKLKQRKVFFGREKVTDSSGLRPITRTHYGSTFKNNKPRFIRKNKATGQTETTTRRGFTLHVPRKRFKLKPRKKQSSLRDVFGNLGNLGR